MGYDYLQHHLFGQVMTLTGGQVSTFTSLRQIINYSMRLQKRKSVVQNLFGGGIIFFFIDNK